MHRSIGGIRYKCFKDYYIASILAQLKPWFTYKSSCLRSSIEALQVLEHSLKNLLLSIPINKKGITALSPTVLATRRSFDYYISNAFRGTNPCKLPLSISILSLLIPNISIKLWEDKGILLMSDLYSDNLLIPLY